MTSAYNLAVILHVLVAILGTGQLGAVAVMLAAARRARTPPADVASVVAPLLRYVRVSLGLLVLTGMAMDWAASGALHHLWWVRLSFLLVVLEFFLLRRATGRLARGGGGLEPLAWSMCGVLGLIAVLMRVKPF